MESKEIRPIKPLDEPLSKIECQVLRAFGMNETPCAVPDLDEWTDRLIKLMVDAPLGYRARLAEVFPEVSSALSGFIEGNLVQRYEMQKPPRLPKIA